MPFVKAWQDVIKIMVSERRLCYFRGMKPILPFMFLFVALACHSPQDSSSPPQPELSSRIEPLAQVEISRPLYTRPLFKDIKVKHYFALIDSLSVYYDSVLMYPINEYILVRANPWIIDTLAHTDYYYQRERGKVIDDQKEMLVFRMGDSIKIPSRFQADSIEEVLKQTLIDINIPEFKLRIVENNRSVRECLVRVGKYDRQYLKTAGREVDLRTHTGIGKIVRVERDPYYVNPATGHRYFSTRRDDGYYTKMPQIPWLEPELDGLRPGTLIHPTTNPESLGKPCSHGCIGMSEPDAWHVYYSAPVGTKIVVRYDLQVINSQGDTLQLQDIYHRGQSISPSK